MTVFLSIIVLLFCHGKQGFSQLKGISQRWLYAEACWWHVLEVDAKKSGKKSQGWEDVDRQLAHFPPIAECF